MDSQHLSEDRPASKPRAASHNAVRHLRHKGVTPYANIVRPKDMPPEVAPILPTRWDLVAELGIRIGRRIRVETDDRKDNRSHVYFITLSGGIGPEVRT